MSRIGKLPITLPADVTVSVQQDNAVTVKGPKGSLSMLVDRDIIISQEEGTLVAARPTEQKRHKAMHGLYRSLINNMVVGVSTGFKEELELVGVGYKATVTGNTLELALGYSHNIFLALPAEVKATAVTEKGKAPLITLESNDKQLIGQVAAKIRSLRKVEPYKGKGVRFVGEVVRRKAGKTASKIKPVMAVNKSERRLRIKRGIRSKISGTAQRPRLSVFRSNKNIYAQLIDDSAGKTLVAVSSATEATGVVKTEASVAVGKALATKAQEQGITEVVFDRSGYLYHGRVKSLAEGAREAGLKF